MLKSSCSSCSQSQMTAYVIDTETVLNFNDDSFTMFCEQQNQWNCHEHIVPSQNKDQEILQNYGDTLMLSNPLYEIPWNEFFWSTWRD